MKTTLLFLAFLSNLTLFGQNNPTIQWQKSLGGSLLDKAGSVQQTLDGGYIIAGFSTSINGDVTGNHGGGDCWIVKLNNGGDLQWQKSLGGSGNDSAAAIQQTADGGYIMAGNSTSIDGDVTGNHGGSDYWIVKLDNIGNIQWQKSLGGSKNDIVNTVQQTTDGGYIVSGTSESNDGDVSGNHGVEDFWVVKLSSSASLEWQKSFGGSNMDLNYSARQTTDGGYIIAGSSFSNDGDVTGNHGGEDFWIVKINSFGNIQWQKSVGGTGDDDSNSIALTSDGGYIVSGSSSSNDGDVNVNHGLSDFWIVKLSSSGSIQWQKSIGGSGDEIAASIKQTIDGGYIVAGPSESSDGDATSNYGFADYWIVKLQNNGNIQWQKSLGGSKSEDAIDIKQTTDEGYIIAGYSQSSDGDVISNQGLHDFWIVKLTSGDLATEEYKSSNLLIYPNPTEDILNFSEEVSNVKVMDISGKIVTNIAPLIKSIDVSHLKKDVYIVTARTKSGRKISNKFIKQ